MIEAILAAVALVILAVGGWVAGRFRRRVEPPAYVETGRSHLRSTRKGR